MNRIFFKISRAKTDPEKVLLPTIMFINSNHPAFEEVGMPGFMISVGWWDFSIKLGFIF